MLHLVGRIFSGTPAAETLARFKALALDPTRSLRVYLSQGLDHTTSDVGTYEVPASGIGDGTVTVAAAATQFIAASTPCIVVHVTARLANAGAIYVGGSTLAGANEGVELQPGSGWTFVIDDVSKLYGWAVNANDVLDFAFMTR